MRHEYTYYPNLGQMQESPRNFVLCVDGTWNLPAGDEKNNGSASNVLKLYGLLADSSRQFARYFPGVGAPAEASVGGPPLGGDGASADLLRDQAYVVLVTNYRPGDRIFLFGFSRGAAIARMLAQKIHQRGIPEAIRIVKNMRGEVVAFENRGGFRPVDIELVGVWETMAAFGIPNGPFQKINLFKNLTVAPNIKQALHLVAVDENREILTPTQMNRQDKVEEVWFPGGHEDVGGGVPQEGLSDLSLAYMMKKAQALGLTFKDNAFQQIHPNPAADIYPHRVLPAGWTQKPREIGVLEDGRLNPARSPNLHVSVKQKMAADPEYRPANVEALKGQITWVE